MKKINVYNKMAFWNTIRGAFDPKYKREEEEKARREQAHRNYIAARDSAQYIFDRANDAGNYNANAQQFNGDIIWYKDRADEFAIDAEKAAIAAKNIYQEANTKAIARGEISDEKRKKIAETPEEEAGFDLIKNTGLDYAKNAKVASDAARKAANNARKRVDDIQNIYVNNPIVDRSDFKRDALQIFYDVEHHLGCGPPCNNDQGGMIHMENTANDYHSNELLASKFKANEQPTLSYMEKSKSYAQGHAWPKREASRVHYESAGAQKNTAVTNKGTAETYLKAIDDSADHVQKYANAHDYGYLTSQIEKIEKDIDDVETKREEVDEPPYDRDLGIKNDYDASMVLYMKELEEQSKINPYDAADIILQQLKAEYGVCTKAVSDIEAEIVIKKGLRAGIAEKIRQKEGEISGLIQRRNEKYSEMLAEQKKFDDLSGELLVLQNEKDILEKSITEEERYYGELLKQKDKLNADIIYWNQKIYSNKVYNSQNLLKLSENIDHNLQYIFSDLKTQNINPNLLHTKIQYRKTEEQKLNNADKVLDVIFYCFYFSFIVIMIVTRNINAEHFIYYIFIGLIPFLFPFVFKNVNYLIHSFQLDHPKNAFIESDELANENMFHAYNI